jgi:Ca2+-binding EF-hand superfamily protein
MSLIITAVFVILADFLLNEQSSFCILPSSFKKLHKIMDLEGDGKISEEEIAKSIKILQKAHKHNQEVKLEKAKEKFNNMKY